MTRPSCLHPHRPTAAPNRSLRWRASRSYWGAVNFYHSAGGGLCSEVIDEAAARRYKAKRESKQKSLGVICLFEIEA